MIKYCSNKCFLLELSQNFFFFYVINKKEKKSHSQRNTIMNTLIACTMGFVVGCPLCAELTVELTECDKGRFHWEK